MKKTQATIKRLQKPPEGSAPPIFKSRSQREKYDRHCAAGGRAFADLDMRSRHDDAVLLDEIAAVIHGVNREHYQFEQLVNGTAHCLTLQSPDIADLRLGLERRQTACPDFNTSALSDLVLKTTACGYGTPSQGCGEIDPPFTPGTAIGIFTKTFRCGDVPVSVFIALCEKTNRIIPVVGPNFDEGLIVLLKDIALLYRDYAPLNIKIFNPCSDHRSEGILQHLEKVNAVYHREHPDCTGPFFEFSQMEGDSTLHAVTEAVRSAVMLLTSITIEAVGKRLFNSEGRHPFGLNDTMTLVKVLTHFAIKYNAEGQHTARERRLGRLL